MFIFSLFLYTAFCTGTQTDRKQIKIDEKKMKERDVKA